MSNETVNVQDRPKRRSVVFAAILVDHEEIEGFCGFRSGELNNPSVYENLSGWAYEYLQNSLPDAKFWFVIDDLADFDSPEVRNSVLSEKSLMAGLWEDYDTEQDAEFIDDGSAPAPSGVVFIGEDEEDDPDAVEREVAEEAKRAAR